MKGLVGIHIHDDIADNILVAKDLGYNLVQFFVEKEPSIDSKIKIILEENKMKAVVHGSYSINIAKDWDQYTVWITQLINEIELAFKYGANLIVVHMGKYLDMSKEHAINNMYSGLIYVHNKTKEYSSVKILLETPAGQGTEIGYKIEDFAKFYKKFSHNKNEEIKNRFGICVDTCHIFAAGYDIRTKRSIDMYLDIFEELIGLRHVGLIHLNDSKTELGSRKDRHESLGKGFIGKEGIEYFGKIFIDRNIPIIFETPDSGHKQDIKLLN